MIRGKDEFLYFPKSQRFGRGYRAGAEGSSDRSRAKLRAFVQIRIVARPQPGNASRQLDIRNDLPASRFKAEQHGGGDRTGGDDGADQHQYREAHVPARGEVGHDRPDQAAEDRALMVAEAGSRTRTSVGKRSDR